MILYQEYQLLTEDAHYNQLTFLFLGYLSLDIHNYITKGDDFLHLLDSCTYSSDVVFARYSKPFIILSMSISSLVILLNFTGYVFSSVVCLNSKSGRKKEIVKGDYQQTWPTIRQQMKFMTVMISSPTQNDNNKKWFSFIFLCGP